MCIEGRFWFGSKRAKVQSVLDELAGASNDIAVLIVAGSDGTRGIHERNTVSIETLLHVRSELRSRADSRHPGSAWIL